MPTKQEHLLTALTELHQACLSLHVLVREHKPAMGTTAFFELDSASGLVASVANANAKAVASVFSTRRQLVNELNQWAGILDKTEGAGLEYLETLNHQRRTIAATLRRAAAELGGFADEN